MSDFPAAYLEVEIDGQPRQFPLSGDRILRIGRSDTNNVVLNDSSVSRNHAMLQASEEGLFYITDCGSINGTFVNETRAATPMILRSGDQIQIGNHKFTFNQRFIAEPRLAGESEPPTNVLFATSLITVLVVDIRDFTGLARRVEASKLSEVTGALFRSSGKELQARGAWGQKYIGDAVMAVWRHKKRAPEIHELAAVLEGLLQLYRIASGTQQQFGLAEPIRIGAGINSGHAMVGNVGSIASSDYTALGDVVNKAFRLESSTREISFDLVVGEETYKYLSGFIDAASLFEKCVVKLKGYDEPATAFGAHLDSLPLVVEALHKSAAPSETKDKK
jgi:class 3 adenylate cyclase